MKKNRDSCLSEGKYRLHRSGLSESVQSENQKFCPVSERGNRAGSIFSLQWL